MVATINAQSGTGVVTSSDTSGIMKVQSNGVTVTALAWVQFAGATGTKASSYNVSSVTRTGTGAYTVNFSNALTDSNYSAVTACSQTLAGLNSACVSSYTTASVGLNCAGLNAGSAVSTDPGIVSVAVFGNS